MELRDHRFTIFELYTEQGVASRTTHVRELGVEKIKIQNCSREEARRTFRRSYRLDNNASFEKLPKNVKSLFEKSKKTVQ